MPPFAITLLLSAMYPESHAAVIEVASTSIGFQPEEEIDLVLSSVDASPFASTRGLDLLRDSLIIEGRFSTRRPESADPGPSEVTEGRWSSVLVQHLAIGPSCWARIQVRQGWVRLAVREAHSGGAGGVCQGNGQMRVAGDAPEGVPELVQLAFVPKGEHEEVVFFFPVPEHWSMADLPIAQVEYTERNRAGALRSAITSGEVSFGHVGSAILGPRRLLQSEQIADGVLDLVVEDRIRSLVEGKPRALELDGEPLVPSRLEILFHNEVARIVGSLLVGFATILALF